MNHSGMSWYRRVLLILTIPPLLLALIGSGLGWWVLGSQVFLWFRAMVLKLLLILGLFAFAGLVGSECIMRPQRDRSAYLKPAPSIERGSLFAAVVTFVVVSLSCAFIPYLTDLTEETVLKIAGLLIVCGLGLSVTFLISFVYMTIAHVRLLLCQV